MTLRCLVAMCLLASILAGCTGPAQPPEASPAAAPTAYPPTPTASPTATASPAPAASATPPPVETRAAAPTSAPASISAARVLRGHTAAVTTLAWSPDGQTLATSSGGAYWAQNPDHSVRLWDAGGRPRAVLSAHLKDVPALAWSPDGRTLATASFDGTVKLWSPDGALRQTLPTTTTSLYTLAWSPDGAMLAAGAIFAIPPPPGAGGFVTLPGVVYLWRPDGTRLNILGTQWTGGKFYNLAWSPDGTMLAAGATDYRIWRADGTLLGSTSGCSSCTPAWAMAWLPDSRGLAVGDENGDLYIYNLGGKIANHLTFTGDVDSAVFSPDGKTLLVGSSHFGVRLIRTNLLNAAGTPASVPTQLVPPPAEPPLAWSPDSTRFAASSGGTVVRVYQADAALLFTLDGCAGKVLSVAWSPSGKTLAAGTDEMLVCQWPLP